MSKYSLEKHKFFPIVAWALIIGFSAFVFSIISDLKKASSSLERTAVNLEMKTKQDVADIDFHEPR